MLPGTLNKHDDTAAQQAILPYDSGNKAVKGSGGAVMARGARNEIAPARARSLEFLHFGGEVVRAPGLRGTLVPHWMRAPPASYFWSLDIPGADKKGSAALPRLSDIATSVVYV